MRIDGKYYFNLRIQDYSDFLKPTDVIGFLMRENCGAAGTMFEMAFMTQNKKIADLIIENNEVIFEIGESPENAVSYKAYISEHPEKKDSADESMISVSFVATLIDMSFYTTRASETIFGTSLDVIKKMAKTYLGTEVDVQIDTPVEAERNWLRSFETGAVTMLQAWLHMNLPKTTPLIWIDNDKVVHVSDVERIKSGGVKHRFVPAQYKDEKKQNDVRYLNSFSTKSYKFDANLVTGKNTIVNVQNIESGDDTVHIPENKPDIASTTEVETGNIGNKIVDNKYQTDNVHSKFMTCYYTNKLRLIQLSSHVGDIILAGVYPNIKICDLIDIIGCQETYAGRYIVNTKITTFAYNSPIKTIVTVCRDNTNSIENSAITPKSQVVLHNQQMTDILQNIRTLRRVTVMGSRFLDGTNQDMILGYCKSFKYNTLNAFRVMGTPLDLNGSLEIMQSLKNIGINIVKSIVDKFIPYPYNLLLHDAVLQGLDFKRLLSKLVYQFAPQLIRDFLIEIVGLVSDLTRLADELFKQNEKQLSNYNYSNGGYSANSNVSALGNASGSPSTKQEEIPIERASSVAKDFTQQNTENIKNITDEFLNNVDGLDIPIPDIGLNESESLLPKDKLKEVIANKIIEHLDGQGYLKGIGSDVFLQMLLGKKPLDFNTIKLINANTGNMLYARYWGTYKGQIDKFGKVLRINNNVITIPDTNITEDIFKGDLVVINGTPKSNGTYTVKNIDYDGVNSYIEAVEEIEYYENIPIRTYTNLCNVSKVVPNVITDKYDFDVTEIYVNGNYTNLLRKGVEINITNLGMDGLCTILDSEYITKEKQTVLRANKEMESKNDLDKKLQIVIETDNSTSIAKLTNNTFTEEFIKNGFKDIYVTIPCTKTVNALKGANLWIAIPNIEKDIDFYINSQKVEMDVIEGVDLKMYAPGGAKLLYNVYISKDTYNSNSVTLEVRRKQQ